MDEVEKVDRLEKELAAALTEIEGLKREISYVGDVATICGCHPDFKYLTATQVVSYVCGQNKAYKEFLERIFNDNNK